jgi:hypothetical protein
MMRVAHVRWNAVPQFAEFGAHTTDLTQADSSCTIALPQRPSRQEVAFDPRSLRVHVLCAETGSACADLFRSAWSTSRATVVIRLDRGRVTSQSALNAVVAHEFGHALGIGAHSTVATDLMFGLPTVEAPSARDAATLRFVLGKTPQLSL